VGYDKVKKSSHIKIHRPPMSALTETLDI